MIFSKMPLRDKGFTLLELIIYVGLAGLTTTCLYEIFLTTINLYNRHEIFVNTTQELRAAISLLTSEIRMAGCDPTGSGNLGFINEEDSSGKDRYDTDEDSINFTSDIIYPYDGFALGANEKVNYYLYPSNTGLKKLGRRTGAARSAQPVAENIVDLSFSYFNANNENITSNPDLKEIGSVQIRITANSKKADPITKRKKELSVTSFIRIRNAKK